MSDTLTDAPRPAGPAMEDWGKIISFRPGLVLRPTSLDELKAMLERIHRGELGNGRVRVPGSLHSCSEIAVSDAILDTSALPKTMDFEAGNAAVVASANVTLHEFLAELGRRGKSVTATGGTDHQTLAGLISTGTAPASSREALYDLLEWVELVTVDPATGRAVERRISRGDADFPAVVCSLGLLGVLTRVGFRVVDERHFSVVQRILDLDDVLADLDATSARYDFWRVNWAPRSEKALLWAATAIPREQSKPGGDYPADRSEHLLEVVFEVVDKLTDTGAAADRRTGAGLRRNGLHIREVHLQRPTSQHASRRPSRSAARGDGRVELPATGHRARARRVPALLRPPRLAEHPHRDRVDARGREPHVAVELGGARLHREVQLHVPHRGVHEAG
jgi:FAD/FMN-containing dehydrogenase